jgi:hypothetical protein
VAHDLETGLAMRPELGAMHGAEAVSEQASLDRAITGLPGGSTVIGDANFGVFSVAYAATQREHPVLLRLSAPRAQRLAEETLREGIGIDRRVVWKPSRAERRTHPELPADAPVQVSLTEFPGAHHTHDNAVRKGETQSLSLPRATSSRKCNSWKEQRRNPEQQDGDRTQLRASVRHRRHGPALRTGHRKCPQETADTGSGV